MNTILIRCPHCKEEMHAPADRESIICMFCGEKIELAAAEKAEPDGKQAAVEEAKSAGEAEEFTSAGKTGMPENAASGRKTVDAAKCRENLQFVLGHTEAVCKDYSAKVRAFKKDTYQGLFEGHNSENYAFYTGVRLALDCAEEKETDDICHQIAEAFIKEQEETLARVKKKNERLAVQMDKNMYMVIYVLPSIKKLKSERADRLADIICEDWRRSFKDSNISASEYESIMQGFKRKLCYVTTAVCRNLNKGEDCEELRLIKAFRDDYLAATKEGEALIEEYYDIAPTLVRRIDKDAEAQAKYLWLWNTYLAPCVAYIKRGENENCRETYCEMMEVLREEYMG